MKAEKSKTETDYIFIRDNYMKSTCAIFLDIKIPFATCFLGKS